MRSGFLVSHENGVFLFHINSRDVQLTDAEVERAKVDDSHLIGGGTIVERARLLAQRLAYAEPETR